MTTKTENRTLLSRFRKDRRGNFAIMGAVAVPLILAAAGFAMDVTNMVLTRAELQDAVDSAALAAASALSNDKKSVSEAEAIGLAFFKAQLSDGITGGTDLTAGTTIDISETASVGSAKSFEVRISTGYDLPLNPLTRLLGYTTTKINANGEAKSATGSKNAISMFLVLDRSGSMSFKTGEIESKTVACQNWTSDNWGKSIDAETPCYFRKIAALKRAVASLVAVLKEIDPTESFVRTGAVSYNDSMQKEVALNWGTGGAMKYVNDLPKKPEGGTDSHGAFAKALEKLAPKNTAQETEIGAHETKNGLKPIKYIIFMTDGENTHYNGKQGKSWGEQSDTETLASCALAKSAGIRVYTVAFMAPANGQKLLKACATSASDYYPAEDMAGLITAFEEIGKSAAAAAARLTQ